MHSSKIPVLLLAGVLLVGLLYLPGLHGPWLLDDFFNLNPFLAYPPGQAPYHELVFSNPSGPLGRAVSMATFAANHALGLFSTPALKATNVLLHLLNSLLLFWLLRALFTQRRPINTLSSTTLAALLSFWWCLLPLQLSTVLYIVQRMTEVSTGFALASLLTYVEGRRLLATRRRPAALLIAASLLLFLPLALFAKESAFCLLPWFLLVELFFFQPRRARPWLTALVVTVLAALVLIELLQPARLTNGYLSRDFTLEERLLTQPRVLFSYMHALFLPSLGQLGIFHDDFIVSHSLLAPASTLAALLGLLGLLGLALYLANSSRWWPLSFGLLFYFAGHLVESTVIPLELYFEHRNYLPSTGLLLAAATAFLGLWPWHRRGLALATGLYFALLAVTTAQLAALWGNEALLLSTSTRYHPESLAAWTSYGELLFARQPALAIQSLERATHSAGARVDVLDLQLISMYCRLDQDPPEELIQSAAHALRDPHSATISIRIGLDEILLRKQEGRCGKANFSALAPALEAYDSFLVSHFGDRRQVAWPLRLTIANWLSELGKEQKAGVVLKDVWTHGNHAAMPLVGLALAKVAARKNDGASLKRVLLELQAVTSDAPADFRSEMVKLQKAYSGPI